MILGRVLVLCAVFWALPAIAQYTQPLQRHLPAHPSLQGTVFLRLPDAGQREELVRLAYSRLEERMREAESDLEFQVANLRTAFPHAFGEIPVTEVITPKGGWSLRWNFKKYSVDGELLGASYHPEWYEARPWATDPKTIEVFEQATIEEWLVKNASPRSSAREMISSAAITFFEVTVTLDGRSRTYNALVLWLPPLDQEGDFQMSFIDKVTPLLISTLTQTLPPARSMAQLEAMVEAEIQARQQKAIGSTCQETESCSSPILIHFGPGQPRLSDAAGGIEFDIDADGTLERVAWPVAGSETAFLAMDRDGNGAIDDATELFGEHTPDQVAGVHGPNGYLALVTLDSYRGDQGLIEGTLDGWIQEAEEHFPSLLLWFDRNRDGRSQPEELEGLADRDVSKLRYDYKLSRRRDRHGNVFRFRGELVFSDSRRQGHSFDVFLLKQEP